MMPMRNKMLEGELDINQIAKINTDDYDIPITMNDFTEALKNISKSVS